MTFGKILREPLLHFLVLGLGLFLLYGHVSPGDADSKRIVVTQARVDDMVRQYAALWGRPPAPTELNALIDSYVREEVLYREGMAMGLGRDDAVIKRRIRQKFDIMAEEDSGQGSPSDADLEAWLKAHSAAFMQPAVVSFDQLLFDPALTSPAAVDAARARLEAGASAASFGTASMLPGHVAETGLDLVARDFGEGFAGKLAALPVGHWAGPVVSGFGVHLVRVSALTPARLPPLAAVRAAVAREWENDRRVRARDASYAKLRASYDIIVEAKPGSDGATKP